MINNDEMLILCLSYFITTVLHMQMELFSKFNWGPLYVLWQVSFGWWVMWSISSWQKYYKSAFFPKAVMGSRTSVSVSQQLRLELSAKFTSHWKKWEKCLLFNLANFWMIKSNCHVPNSFFGICNCKFYHLKIEVLLNWRRRQSI